MFQSLSKPHFSIEIQTEKSISGILLALQNSQQISRIFGVFSFCPPKLKQIVFLMSKKLKIF